MSIAVFGASGYTGGELLRILISHPSFSVAVAISREYAGKPIYMAHPHLKGLISLKFSTVEEAMSKDYDYALLALPHGLSKDIVPSLLDTGVKIVDLGADFRLKDPSLYPRWYGWKHPHPELLEEAVYGLPELHREEIKGARLVASPGCNATATILASAPLVKLGARKILADVKVGSSEAGSKPSRSSHHPERSGAIRPYSASGHRHQVEAQQELSELAKDEVKVSMVPHSVGSVRGAFASAHAQMEVSESELWREFARFYAGEPFIRVMQRGTYPNVKNVIGSNFADLGFSSDPSLPRVTGFAAIDNLMKGAAGQAMQSLNIMAGVEETLGLNIPPVNPV